MCREGAGSAAAYGGFFVSRLSIELCFGLSHADGSPACLCHFFSAAPRNRPVFQPVPRGRKSGLFVPHFLVPRFFSVAPLIWTLQNPVPRGQGTFLSEIPFLIPNS